MADDVEGGGDLGSASEDTGELFKKAAEWMRTNTALKLSTAQKLCAYGLYKQVNDCLFPAVESMCCMLAGH